VEDLGTDRSHVNNVLLKKERNKQRHYVEDLDTDKSMWNGLIWLTIRSYGRLLQP